MNDFVHVRMPCFNYVLYFFINTGTTNGNALYPEVDFWRMRLIDIHEDDTGAKWVDSGIFTTIYEEWRRIIYV